MPKITNVAGYKFAPLSDLASLRERLLKLASQLSLKGSILLSPEGINLFVAGAPDNVQVLLAELRSLPDLADFEVKTSETDHQPFNRMLVRIKKEIIAFGVNGIDPTRGMARRLSAGQYGKHAAAKNAGFKKDDVIVELDGISQRMSEGELMGLLLQKHQAGEKVKASVLRAGQRVELSLPMQ